MAICMWTSPTISPSLSLTLSPVHGHEVLCGRAAVVSRLQLLRLISLHVAARSPLGCFHTGLPPLSTREQVKYYVNMYYFYCRSVILYFDSYRVMVFSVHLVFYDYFCFSMLNISWICYLCRSTCGPFRNGETVFNVTAVCVDSLPSPAPGIIRYLASEAFALPLILAEM